MSFKDFTDAKALGTRIFRPYSDVLAEIELRLEYLLPVQPEVGSDHLPIHKRDLIFPYGSRRGSLLLLSSKAARHFPVHIGGDLAEIHPEYDFTSFGDEAKLFRIDDIPDDFSAVLDPIAFDNPVTLAWPPFPFHPVQNDAKGRITQQAAQIIVEAEQRRYMDKSEEDRPKRIFLSHRSIDKEIGHDVADSLREIGFDPWLDEDAMPAGADLERSIKDGIVCSCAAVFFVTPHFMNMD